MPSQRGSGLVRLAATVAQERLVSRVTQHVCSEIAACPACILTHVALERFDALVDPNVSAQV